MQLAHLQSCKHKALDPPSCTNDHFANDKPTDGSKLINQVMALNVITAFVQSSVEVGPEFPTISCQVWSG